MSLALYPKKPRAGSTALAVYVGTPLRTVSWSLTGNGSILPLSTHTDANGIASCKVTPVNAGDAITVTVVAGA